MAARKLTDAADLTVADLIHGRSPSLPATATVGDVRDWFAQSSHRRLAVLADDGRYAGSVTPADVASGVDRDVPATRVARDGPTVEPDVPAREGHRLAASTESRRVAVVDGAGYLVGVLAVTDDLSGFCGTSSPVPSM